MTLDMSELPPELRELLRLSNQRAQKLEGALRMLLGSLEASGTLEPEVSRAISELARGDEQQSEIERITNHAGWLTLMDVDAWNRPFDPGPPKG